MFWGVLRGLQGMRGLGGNREGQQGAGGAERTCTAVGTVCEGRISVGEVWVIGIFTLVGVTLGIS